VELAPHLSLDLSGIVGDQEHTYGYHRARAVLPADDYSVRLLEDRMGDPWAASALDITPAHRGGMVILTRRLLAAAKRRDPRITRVVREFFGTVDGVNVTGFDVIEKRHSSADSSHLYHLHISFLRRFACNAAALAPVADVLATPLAKT
jgi:hypothetical protein